MKISKYFYDEVQKMILKNHPEYAHLNHDELCKETIDLDDSPRMRGDENDLFDVIYGLDPDTKLPKGDILMYVSARTSPEVRQFILDNLMSPNNVRNTVPAGNDDLILELTRGKDESSQDYALRVSQVFQDSKKELVESSAKVVESKT